MKEYFIDLTDGTRVQIKLNFGTLYYLQKCRGFYRLIGKYRKAEKKGIPKEKALTEAEGFELAADIVYAVLRSNGRSVKFDEALSLTPPDSEGLAELLEGFQSEYEKYDKKKQAKMTSIPKK